MTTSLIRLVQLSGTAERPLLILGPSLGTSVEALWGAVAQHLADDFHVVGWDLPGHGRASNFTDDTPVSIPGLAADVAAAVAELSKERGHDGETFHYAGCSIGGAVGLQLAVDSPDRLRSLTTVCSAAVFGTPQGWHERAATVREQGTGAILTSSAERWFAPGFIAANGDISGSLLHSLQHADRFAYARLCEALANFDVRERLTDITTPVLAIAGGHDIATPVASSQEIVDGVATGQVHVLSQVAHLAPAEAPLQVAALISQHARNHGGEGPRTVHDVYDDGMRVRRQVLSDAHVDRANASKTEFTTDFQEFITQYAWGTIWTRPGLDRRSRSMITLTALIALGHDEELGMHVRAALRNGLSREEIKEVLLHSAIYCGVPSANTAFRIAQETFEEIDAAQS